MNQNQNIIDELILQANDDLGASKALLDAGYNAHALFWLHLVLEKLCKAVWVKKNNNEKYPYIDNLIKLLKDSKIDLSDEQIIFYTDMNQFQAKGRYLEDLVTKEKTITKDLSETYFQKVNPEIKWLKNLLQ